MSRAPKAIPSPRGRWPFSPSVTGSRRAYDIPQYCLQTCVASISVGLTRDEGFGVCVTSRSENPVRTGFLYNRQIPARLPNVG